VKIGFSSPRVRRTAVAAVAVTAALATATACSSSKSSGSGGSKAASSAGSSGAAVEPVTGLRFNLMVQSTPNANKVVEVHAIDLLKKQGADASVKWNASTPNVAIAQLRSGDLDAYSEAVSGGVAAVQSGVPLMDIALAQPRQDYVFLAKSGINTLADLKGKKIGVQDTTGVNYAQALLVVQKAGLTPKDVTIIAVGGQSERLPALVAGRVDATMLSHAAQLSLAGKGFNTLFDYTKEASNLYDDNVFVTPDWLKKNHALAVAFNKAMLDSFVWFNDPANKDAVVTEALAIQPSVDKAQTAQLFDLLRSADAYPNGSILDPTLLDQQQQLYKSAGALVDTVPVSQWVDDSYAKLAKAEK
jgi:ABC-type nitrate/sulfonate/bicarbonate transport system substrate-binding protein